jgi:hypothetical protein
MHQRFMSFASQHASRASTTRRSLPWVRVALVSAVALSCNAATAQSGEVYVGVGLPGLTLGYAYPVSANFGVRGEASTLGTRKQRRSEEGIEYDARLKADRFSLLGDWYPGGTGFRLTAGLAANNYKLTLDGSGAGGSITVGNTTYQTTAADGLTVLVKMPSTVPYLGVGYGHQQGSAGFRFGFDLGAYIGKGKVSSTPRGQLASAQAQADVNREVAEIRDGVGKIKALPQLGVSMGYAF